MDYEIRPSRSGDYEAITGEPIPFRSTALTALVDGEIVGMGGVAHLPNGAFGAFAEITDAARQYPVLMHRTGLQAMKRARLLGYRRLVALKGPGIDRAEAWLVRLGFERELIDDVEVWIWRK